MKKGFTLIELMVVVVIIGILAALAIPKFMGATDKAKLSEWKNITKQIVTLQNSYFQYNDAYASPTAEIQIAESPQATTAKPVTAAGVTVQKQLGFSAPGGDSRFHYYTNGSDSAAIAIGEAALAFGDVKVGDRGAMTVDGQVDNETAATIAAYVLNIK